MLGSSEESSLEAERSDLPHDCMVRLITLIPATCIAHVEPEGKTASFTSLLAAKQLLVFCTPGAIQCVFVDTRPLAADTVDLKQVHPLIHQKSTPSTYLG